MSEIASEGVETESGDIIQLSSVVRCPHLSDSNDCETIESKATQQDESNHCPLEPSPITRRDESGQQENYEDSIHRKSPSPSPPCQAYKDPEYEYEREDNRHSSASIAPSSEESPSSEQRHQYHQFRQIETICTDDYEGEQEEAQKEIPISTHVHRNTSSNQSDENSDITSTNFKESDSPGDRGTDNEIISHGIKRKISIDDLVISGTKLGRATSKGQQDSHHSQKPRGKADAKVSVTYGPDSSRANTSRNVTLTRSGEPDLTISQSQQAQDVDCVNGSEGSRQTPMDASNHPNDRSHNQSHDYTDFFNSLNVTRVSQDQLQRMHSYSYSTLYWASQFRQHPRFPLFNSSADTPPLDFLIQFAAYEIEALSQHLSEEQNAHLQTRRERDELELHLRDLELQYTRLSQRLTRAERREY
ncbi:hypothetical protein BGZ80_009742 [Entomortierella chlamydospora]|uniref:Uncharacterized protein n=1 Tax=Entomortierella chlamydospora TaxID=101097 RepID=A0A9P6T3X2_9FUNG|nr:hypothetical protein BGZ80_009742 [Entomortierella chlamydospora]